MIPRALRALMEPPKEPRRRIGFCPVPGKDTVRNLDAAAHAR